MQLVRAEKPAVQHLIGVALTLVKEERGGGPARQEPRCFLAHIADHLRPCTAKLIVIRGAAPVPSGPELFAQHLQHALLDAVPGALLDGLDGLQGRGRKRRHLGERRHAQRAALPETPDERRGQDAERGAGRAKGRDGDVERGPPREVRNGGGGAEAL